MNTTTLHLEIFMQNNRLYFTENFVKKQIGILINLKEKRDVSQFLSLFGKLIFQIEDCIKNPQFLKQKKLEQKKSKEEIRGFNLDNCSVNIFLSRLHNELGIAKMHSDDAFGAREHFEKAHALFPENLHSLYNLADLAFNEKDFVNALSYLSKILQKEPNHVASIYLSGLCHSCAGDPDTALSFFQKTAELDQCSIGANYWTGECFLHKEEYEKAIPYFQRNYELAKEHLDSARGLAICYLAKEEADKCLAICDYLLEQQGTHQLITYQIKGDALICKQDFERGALWHAELAKKELDARDFITNQAKQIYEKYGIENAKRYATIIIDNIQEMRHALGFLFDRCSIPKYENF